jgi:NAD(P)H-dependent FMN reductase
MHAKTILGLSATIDPSARTAVLLEQWTQTIATGFHCRARTTDLAAVDASLRAARYRSELLGPARELLLALEQADALVVAFSGRAAKGFPGLFKHLLDMADPELVRGKPVILIFTGVAGSPNRAGILQSRLLFRTLGLQVLKSILCRSNDLQSLRDDEDFYLAESIARERLRQALFPATSARGGSVRRRGDLAPTDPLGQAARAERPALRSVTMRH